MPGGDFLLTGTADSAAVPGTYNTSHFYVRADSLGNWRSRLHYLPPSRAGSTVAALQALPQGGALWAHTVNPTPYVAGSRTGNWQAQLVRFDSLQRIVWQRRYTGPTPLLPNADMDVAGLTTLLDGSLLVVGMKARPFVPGPGFIVNSGWMQRIKANGDTVNLPEYFGNIYEAYQPQEVQATADGGFVVAGSIFPDKYVPAFNCCPDEKAWLAKFDSLGTLQWEQRVQGRNPALSPDARFTHVQPLANGQYLVSGARGGSMQYVLDAYLATYAPTATGAAPVWEVYVSNNNPNAPDPFDQQTALQADGSIILAGRRNIPHVVGGRTQQDPAGLLTRFANVGAPLVLNYCQHPPVPNAGYSLTLRRDTLTLVDFSTGGPRFAQVERWRWHFPDGSFYEGRTPPPHRFAQRPPPGPPSRSPSPTTWAARRHRPFIPSACPRRPSRPVPGPPGPACFPTPRRVGKRPWPWPGCRPGPPSRRR